MAKILMVGCGDIATGLSAELAASGHQCFGLRRQSNQLPDTIQALQGDVTDPQTLTGLPEGLDFVVVTLTPASLDEAGYRRSYVEGLRNLIKALHDQKQSLQRLLFVSSTSVYGQSHGEWIDEYSDTTPAGYAGKVMLEAERLAQQCGFASTRIRFSGIYGPGKNRMLQWVREGIGCASYPPHYSNRIHRDDCIGVLRHLIEMNLAGQFPEDLYLASDPNPTPYHKILEWLREQLGVESEPGFDISSKLRGGSKRCSCQRLLNSGYQFRHPDFRSGFKALLTTTEQQR